MPEPAQAKKRIPSTPILGLEGETLADYWSWAYSDVLSNVNRSVLAEFLVAHALGLTIKPRVEWDAYDLDYSGLLIEVKAAGRRQSWDQKHPSPIKFDIAPKRSWFAATGQVSKDPGRPAHIYVFCVHLEYDQSDPLDCKQWAFYVVLSSELWRVFGKQKSVSLSALNQRIPCNAEPLAGLKTAIDTAWSRRGNPRD